MKQNKTLLIFVFALFLFSGSLLSQQPSWPVADTYFGYNEINATFAERHSAFHGALDLNTADNTVMNAILDGVVLEDASARLFFVAGHDYSNVNNPASHLKLVRYGDDTDPVAGIFTGSSILQDQEVSEQIDGGHLHFEMWSRQCTSCEWYLVNPLDNPVPNYNNLPPDQLDTFAVELNDLILEPGNLNSGFLFTEGAGLQNWHHNSLKIHKKDRPNSTGTIHEYNSSRITVFGEILPTTYVRDTRVTSATTNSGHGLGIHSCSSYLNDVEFYSVEFDQLEQSYKRNWGTFFNVKYNTAAQNSSLYGNNDYLKMFRGEDDQNTSVHKNMSNGIWNTRKKAQSEDETNLPGSVKYPDGYYDFNFIVEDANENVDSIRNKILVDNFMPYVLRFSVESSFFGEVFKFSREESETSETLGMGYVTNSEASATGNSNLSFVTPVFEFSEIMSFAEYRFSYDNGQNWSNWNVLVQREDSTLNYSGDTPILFRECLLFNVRGSDLANNQLINIYSSTDENSLGGTIPLPVRNGPNSWVNLPDIIGEDFFTACSDCTTQIGGLQSEGTNHRVKNNCDNISDYTENKIIGCDGSVLLSLDGLTSAFNIGWFNGEEYILGTESIIGSEGQNCYRIEALDACCFVEGCILVTEEDLLQSVESLDVNILNNTLLGSCDGQIILENSLMNSSFQYVVLGEANDTISSGNLNFGSIIISNLCAGIYSVIFQNISGCELTEQVNLIACDNIIESSFIQAFNASSCNTADGSLRLFSVDYSNSASLPVVDSWWTWNGEIINLELGLNGGGSSNSSGEILFSGEYCWHVIDSNGCLGKTCVSIGYDFAPTLNLVEVMPTCIGGSSGSIYVITDENPLEDQFLIVLLNENEESVDTIVGVEGIFSGLSEGDYIVEVIWPNNEDCSTLEFVTLESFDPGILAPLEFTVEVDQPCHEQSDGVIAIVPEGGLSPYTIEWSDFSSIDNDFNRYNLQEGIYTFEIMDRCGSIKSGEVRLSGLITNIAVDQGCETGRLVAIANEGTPPYSYTWSNGSTDQSINDLSSGTYTVTIEDASGRCIKVHTETIQNTGITVSQTDPTCTGISVGEISILVQNPHGRELSFFYNGSLIQLESDPQSPNLYFVEGISPGERVELSVLIGGCVFKETVEIGTLPLSEELNRFENNTCFYDQFCGDSLINSNGAFSAPDVPIAPTGTRSGAFSDCSAPIFCRGEEVGTRRAALSRVPLAVYFGILDQAVFNGFLSPADQAVLISTLPERGLNNCNTLRFCPLSLDHTGITWLVGSHGTGTVDNRGCIDFRCPFWATRNYNTCTELESVIAESGLGEIFSSGNVGSSCRIVSFPILQLLLWEQDLINEYGEDFTSSTLYDRLQEIDEFASEEVSACSDIYFCNDSSNKFEYVYDNLGSVDCTTEELVHYIYPIIDGEVVQVATGDTSYINTCERTELLDGEEVWTCTSSSNRINSVRIQYSFDERLFNLLAPDEEEEETSVVSINGQSKPFYLKSMPYILSNGVVSTKGIVTDLDGDYYMDFTPYDRKGSMLTNTADLDFYLADYDNDLYYSFFRESIFTMEVVVSRGDGSYSRRHALSSDQPISVDYADLSDDRTLSVESDGNILLDGNVLKYSSGRRNLLYLSLLESGEIYKSYDIEITNPSSLSLVRGSVNKPITSFSGLSTGRISIRHSGGERSNIEGSYLYNISPKNRTVFTAPLNVPLNDAQLLATTKSSKLIAASLVELNKSDFRRSSLVLTTYNNSGAGYSSLSVGNGAITNNHLLELPNSEVLYACNFTGTLNVGGRQFTSAGENDIFIGTFNQEAQLISFKTYGSPSNEEITELLFHNDQIYFGGHYDGAAESRELGLLTYLQENREDSGMTSFTRPYLTHVSIHDLSLVQENRKFSNDGSSGDFLDSQVIPNPAETAVSFIIPRSLNDGQIRIYDGLGREFRKVGIIGENTFEGRVNIDLIGMQSGVYFYTIESKLYSKTGKLIIK